MTSAPPVKKIRVMVVDDHVLMRIGLSSALNSQEGLEVVGEAEDGVEASGMFRTCNPDVVIVDLRMPKRNGIETIQQLNREFRDVKVLVLSNYGSADEIESALQAGALGFVPKNTPLLDLVTAIRHVSEGLLFLPASTSSRLASKITSQISQREVDVLRLIGKGLSNKEIADKLGVTESTIKGHVTHLLMKLGVADRTQAVLSGYKRGLINLE